MKKVTVLVQLNLEMNEELDAVDIKNNVEAAMADSSGIAKACWAMGVYDDMQVVEITKTETVKYE